MYNIYLKMSFFLIFSDVSGIFLLPREVRALPWDEPPLHRSGAQITFFIPESIESTARNPSSFYVDCRLYRPTYEEVGMWRVDFGLRPPYYPIFFSPGIHVTKQAEYNRRSLGVEGRKSLGH